MKLSTKTRYGVRAVFDIAYHNQGRPTQARDIARRQDVPLRYLEQIFQELRRANLVDAKRGPKGGYFLSRTPESITLGDDVPAEMAIDRRREAMKAHRIGNAPRAMQLTERRGHRDIPMRGLATGVDDPNRRHCTSTSSILRRRPHLSKK